MSQETALALAGIGIALAVPATFMFANWVRKNVDHGEARFDTTQRKEWRDEDDEDDEE